jgi:calpain-7
MAFNTFAQGQKIASVRLTPLSAHTQDLANRAILAESSLSSLGPLQSALPVLQRAFPLYISAAETYSHLLTSSLVPESERAGIKKKWRLVLDRAEKVKARVEELGGHVGKVDVGDEGVEEDIRRRGGRMNGLELGLWREPAEREFRGEVYRDAAQPDLADEQVRLGAELAPVENEAWDVRMPTGQAERWVVTQGAGADCSVVAGIGVCLEHNKRWKRRVSRPRRALTQLAINTCYPSAPEPVRSENGKHVIKLLLNGAWRGVSPPPASLTIGNHRRPPPAHQID